MEENELIPVDNNNAVEYTDTKVFFNGNLDFLTGLHFELVNTVVNYFFQEDIDSKIGRAHV